MDAAAPNHSMTIWRRESPTLINGWYQAFEGNASAAGSFDFCYSHASDNLHAGLMDYRVLVEDEEVVGPVDFNISSPSEDNCTRFDAADDETIRVEHRYLGSPGNNAVWLDFEILEANSNIPVPMDYFESGASQYTQDLYRCMANAWIAGTLDQCVSP